MADISIIKLPDGNSYNIKDSTARSGLSSKQDASTAVTHTKSTAVGSASVPVYINASGVATACSSFSYLTASEMTTLLNS